MHDLRSAYRILVGSVIVAVAGCSSSPSPQSPPPPPNAGSVSVGPAPVVSGAADSVGALPGSADALYTYRFRQIDPASDRFTFQDRDLNFYFKPSPDAIHFQIENRQNRPVMIEWDRSSITDPWGRTELMAHASTKYTDRFTTPTDTTIPGLQRYGDYVFPMSYLVDPGSSGDQLHRPLFPEGSSAPQYSDKQVTVALSLRMEGESRPYSFTFRVESVTPR